VFLCACVLLLFICACVFIAVYFISQFIAVYFISQFIAVYIIEIYIVVQCSGVNHIIAIDVIEKKKPLLVDEKLDCACLDNDQQI
jgi:hypothetical protein